MQAERAHRGARQHVPLPICTVPGALFDSPVCNWPAPQTCCDVALSLPALSLPALSLPVLSLLALSRIICMNEEARCLRAAFTHS